MDDRDILDLYDAEMRIRPPPEEGVRLERIGSVVRQIGEECCIIYSGLDRTNAPTVVARETAFFRSLGKAVEWKLYGHDGPANLAELLRSAGYVPDPPETLLVRELSEPPCGRSGPEDLRIRQKTDEAGFRVAAAVSEEAFGRGHGIGVRDLLRRRQDSRLAVFVAYLRDSPVASGRLELPRKRAFASLWGGGTAPEFRGRGIYRDLVSARAEMARARGYRFITVDARESSRPILEGMGFRPVDTITGWVLRPGNDREGPVERPSGLGSGSQPDATIEKQPGHRKE